MVPLDLNSILYAQEMNIAKWLNQIGNGSESSKWAVLATARSEALHALMWNETLYSYFDYNITSNTQNIYIPADDDSGDYEQGTAPEGQQILFSIAQFYPFWTGAAPGHLKGNPLAVEKAYSRVSKYLDDRAGGIPATNFKTGQQWDQPSVWPPLMHILMAGLLNTPATFGSADPAYKSVTNLALRLGQRYLDSTFCTWYATGGSTSATPQLQGLSAENLGTMFEKYDDNSTNVAGSGGEYAVVEGFGWTNGVLLYTVETFGNNLKRPDCGNISAANVHPEKRSLPQRAVELSHSDAAWIKKFDRRSAKNERK
jgi:alpha,alpha-trehalase